MSGTTVRLRAKKLRRGRAIAQLLSKSGERLTMDEIAMASATVGRARAWRMHDSQSFEEDRDELLMRFRAGRPREVAERRFTGGEMRIEALEPRRAVKRERVLLTSGSA